MDTVVKSMLDEDPSEEQGLMLFGRDLSKIPCFRSSFIYGISSGVAAGFAAFMRTSKPQLSSHVAMGSFCTVTLAYWAYCRAKWSQQLHDANVLQEALKHKMKYEGTAVEKELEQKGILTSV